MLWGNLLDRPALDRYLDGSTSLNHQPETPSRLQLPDESGRFNIRQLPPGDYELTIWHERAGYLERNLRVTVPEQGAAEIDLEIGVEQLFDL